MNLQLLDIINNIGNIKCNVEREAERLDAALDELYDFLNNTAHLWPVTNEEVIQHFKDKEVRK